MPIKGPNLTVLGVDMVLFTKIAKYFRKITELFLPPGMALRAEGEKQNTLLIVNACIILFAVDVITMTLEMVTKTTSSQISVSIFISLFSAAVLFLGKKGYSTTLLAYLMTAGSALLIYSGAWTTGGSQSQNMLWLLLIPFVASWLISPRFGYSMAVVLTIAIIPFYWSPGWYMENPATGFSRNLAFFATYVLLFYTVCFFCSRFIFKIHNAEENARQSKSAVKFMQKHVKTGFFIVDTDLRIQNGYSDHAKNMFGRSLEHVLLSDLLFDEDEKKRIFEKNLERVFATRDESLLQKISGDYQVQGRYFYLQGALISSYPHSTIMFTINDVTKQMQVKKEAFFKEVIINVLRYKQRFLSFYADTKEILSDAPGTRQEAISKLSNFDDEAKFFRLTDLSAKINHLLTLSDIPVANFFAINNWLNDFINRHETLRELTSEEGFAENLSVKIDMDIFETFLRVVAKATPEKKGQIIEKFLQQIERSSPD